ncbi:hypothetical protein [Phaeodactylibacter xiamenensis]|uniref:hypothetical protein n=1 Tax=Phaeodactylibacter xiamenensis TaxID=1524460 RepID=UPI0024A93137|nr:hypothetical protein [Phaeodactylibacter xiamenensis]
MKTPAEFEEKIAYLESAPFEEVAQFIKRRKKTYRRAAPQTQFWTSNFLVKWAAQILDLPYAIDFLFDYFQQSDTNPGFLQEAVGANPKLMERAIKLSKAHENDEHWRCMDCMSAHKNTRLRVFYKELDYLRKLDKHWKKKGGFYEGVISALDYEDILIHTVSSFERFKRSEQTIENQSLQTSHEVHYSRVLNHILNIKRESQPDTAVAKKYDLSEFRKKVSDVMPPLNPAEGVVRRKYLPRELITPEKKQFRDVIDFYFSYLSTQYQIEKYLCGYADFEIIDGLEAELKINDEFAIHWRNDKKSIFQDNLTINKALQNQELLTHLEDSRLELSEKQVASSNKAANISWKYLCLPATIKSETQNELEVQKLFELLVTLSDYLMPDGRYITYNKDRNPPKPIAILKRSKPKHLERLFKGDYLYVDERDGFIQNIAKYFGWNPSEVQPALDFVTLDLGRNAPITIEEIDILSRPLIKIGTHYIWLSSFMKNRRWDTLLHKRIAKERLFDHQKQSAEMEVGLAKSFLDAGFKAIPSWKYNHGKEEGGEIDTLAFKDTTLFVIELKTSFLDEDLVASNKYRELRFDFKASDQLSNHLEHIEDNFESFRSNIPELSIDCDWEALTIIPLIVSNIFEFDDQLISEQYRKVSLFELQVILRNDLYDALHNRMRPYLPNGVGDVPVANIFQNYNQRNPQFKNEQILPQDKAYYNLWSSPDTCSPQDILSAIEERKVWQGLDGMMEFGSGERIMIGGI